MHHSKTMCHAICVCLMIWTPNNEGFAQLKEDSIALKYKYIGQASKFRKLERYHESIGQLDSALLIFRNDPSILLFKGDLLLELKDYGSAVKTLKGILPTNYEKTITRINLSYALFMNHKPALALKFAHEAWQEDKVNVNAMVNYFNAMLWNIKTKDAARFLSAQDTALDHARKLVLHARLHMTNGHFIKGLKYYDSLINVHPDKNYIREYAEVLLNKNEVKKSDRIMTDARSKFSEQEFKSFKEKMNVANQHHLGIEYVYFNDIANNIRTEYNVSWKQGGIQKYRLQLKGSHVNYRSQQEKGSSATGLGLHIDAKFSKTLSGETQIRFQEVSVQNGPGFSALTGQQIIRYTPNDRRMFALSYSRDILNYTSGLMGKNIQSSYFGYITHIVPDGKTGFYSQGSLGSLTDQNNRYQFFGSLYRILKNVPTIKSGINFSALHFSDSLNKMYFSPDRYLNTEFFLDFASPLPATSKTYLQIQAASGIQKINQMRWERSARIQAEVGVRSRRLETGLRYQYSNVASNSGSGYSYHWTTIYLMCKW
jgi:tetratricopeptide (TPR) repeat protein